MALREGLPDSLVYWRLILVVVLVVADDVVAVRISFIELLVGRLLRTLSLAPNDVVRVEEGLVSSLLV